MVFPNALHCLAVKVYPMEKLDPYTRLESLLGQLETLARRQQQISRENRQLREQHEALLEERNQLARRNDEARSRVEAMIERLKTLEQQP